MLPFHLNVALSRLCYELLGGGRYMIPLSLALWWTKRTEKQRALAFDGAFLIERLQALAQEVIDEEAGKQMGATELDAAKSAADKEF